MSFYRGYFQPDILIENQINQSRRKKLEPEAKLLLAILEDAVETFQKYIWIETERRHKLAVEVEKWFMSESEDDLFSFHIICTGVGIEPTYMRRGLIEWKRKCLEDLKKYKRRPVVEKINRRVSKSGEGKL